MVISEAVDFRRMTSAFGFAIAEEMMAKFETGIDDEFDSGFNGGDRCLAKGERH
jgi:hypothetical protein